MNDRFVNFILGLRHPKRSGFYFTPIAPEKFREEFIRQFQHREPTIATKLEAVAFEKAWREANAQIPK